MVPLRKLSSSLNLCTIIASLLLIRSSSLNFPFSASSVVNSPGRSTTESSNAQKTLGLITFDLDDTLFYIAPAVADANIAMINKMSELGVPGCSLEGVTEAMKSIRTEVRNTGKPITYSELRLRGIEAEMKRCLPSTNLSNSNSRIVFDAWLEERHASAERNLLPFAVEALMEIKNAHPNALIGAVTNGRGNPLDMPNTLAPLFDFCVSGEDEHVFPNRKPDRGIYEAALAKSSILAGGNSMTSCWVHLGDDLTNDVGASAACGAYAVWLSCEDEESGSTSVWSTATEEERLERSRQAKRALKFVDARITCLSKLPQVISTMLLSEKTTANDDDDDDDAFRD